MINSYEVAEVMEVGKAHDVILGGEKFQPIVPDSIVQEWRLPDSMDDE